MITIDKTGINAEQRDAPLTAGLEEFAYEVSMLKPLCNFKADDDCVKIHYSYDKATNTQTRTKEIYKVKAFQDGEELGAISISERYHRGNKEFVYGLHSFRINKERGDREATLTKNLKVALRTAKKVLVNRQDEELRALLNEKVSVPLNSLVNSARSYAMYAMDTNNEVFNFAMLAYQARLRGETTITVSSTPVTLSNPAKLKDHDNYCEKFTVASFLEKQFKDGRGYAVKTYPNGSIVVLNKADESIKKYASFDLLPDDIQSKLGMFKVIDRDDPYAHLGCKFVDDCFYIVAGDMSLES